VSAPQGWSKNGLPRCWREQERAAYDQFWQEHHLDDTIHQVGGIPFAWGKPVETDCVKFADDDYLNHPTYKAFHERMKKDGAPMDWPDYKEAWQAWSAFEARERATHFARADSWQLVLQVDSDSDAGMQWGDLGRL
jgi:hypothetical protein